MSNIQYYHHQKLSEHVTAIFSMTGEIMYLIEGCEKTVLVDTCLGVGHLKDYVEKLTNKPITVLLTHGHVDHALGAPEFDDVYMNHKDTDVYLSMNQLEVRKGYIEGILREHTPAFADDDFVAPAPMTFKDLKEGDFFDLGGVSIEAYEMPGHTPGSMIFLIPEERSLILGDACNKFTYLFDENSSSVAEYKQQVVRVNQLLDGQFDKIYCSHVQAQFPKEMLGEMVDVCDCILDGKSDNIPFPFQGRTDACIAKNLDERMNRLDGGTANIVFNINKIR